MTSRKPAPKRKAWKRWSAHVVLADDGKRKVCAAIIYGRGLGETWLWLHENVSDAQLPLARAIVRALNAARVTLPRGRR